LHTTHFRHECSGAVPPDIAARLQWWQPVRADGGPITRPIVWHDEQSTSAVSVKPGWLSSRRVTAGWASS
jgi:hypothetical protein